MTPQTPHTAARRLPQQADPHLVGNPGPVGHGQKPCPRCGHLSAHTGCDMCVTCQLTDEDPDD